MSFLDIDLLCAPSEKLEVEPLGYAPSGIGYCCLPVTSGSVLILWIYYSSNWYFLHVYRLLLFVRGWYSCLGNFFCLLLFFSSQSNFLTLSSSSIFCINSKRNERRLQHSWSFSGDLQLVDIFQLLTSPI